MADDPLESLRLSLMQDFLPVGLAMVDRVRKGGASKVVEAFTDSNDPIADLRDEGQSAASSLRDHLDRFSPGLGNPVMPVQVGVEEATTDVQPLMAEENLITALARIEQRLDAIKSQLDQEDIDIISNE